MVMEGLAAAIGRAKSALRSALPVGLGIEVEVA
jgi:hypothetical protein